MLLYVQLKIISKVLVHLRWAHLLFLSTVGGLYVQWQVRDTEEDKRVSLININKCRNYGKILNSLQFYINCNILL